MKHRLHTLLALLSLPFLGSCASLLTKWHDDSYVAVLDREDPQVLLHDGEVRVTEGPDMQDQADALYAQGYLLLGYSKFTHTLVPGFNAMYAKMYGERLGAEVVMQETPKKVSGDVYAYTVTYWARGRDYPVGAYYNDVPEDTRLYYPDSLREYLDGGLPVLVEEVVIDSPAAVAGVRSGELIIGIDGEPLGGAEDLDQRLRECSERPTELALWGPNGIRTAQLDVGRVATTNGAIPGAEALFYRAPWELDDYQDFSYISHAFQQAWKDAVAAYQAQVEAERQAAYDAWQNSRISALENSSVQYSEHNERRRHGSISRMGVPLRSGNGDFSWATPGGNGLGPAYGDLMSSWYFTHKNQWTPTVAFGQNAAY